MSYRVQITEDADKDLRDIFAYIAYKLESVMTAERQLDRIEQEILSLDTLPFRYRLYEQEPWCSMGVRRFAVNHYCVFYVPDEATKTVSILRVLYGGRDIDRIMSAGLE